MLTMSSSCLSGGGRTYAIDLDIIKCPSNSIRTSNTSSPSSTLSESSNSPLAISTRKPRTARKRPKQTYNEAAALLSTVYPNIFSTKNLKNPTKFTKPHDYFFDETAEILLPFREINSSGFLPLHQPVQDKPSFRFEPKAANSVELSSEEFHDDFDAESILDEEIEQGIDSIMGNLSVKKESIDESNNNYWYGNPFGGKMELGLGIRRGIRALRHVDEGNWWSFPCTVDVLQISPKLNSTATKKISSSEKKKNKAPPPNTISGELLLKLKYDDVVTAWSDKGSPFLDETLSSDALGNDVSARLAQIDLFSDSGVREASVLRYKEKRRTRLFSKKIRYQVRKVNADRRPRMKGRFVRRSNGQDEKGKKKVLLSDL
ncbi:hypothetical protein Ddye_021586 [Dipteronia dyeriana]|uniref:CCT domain-containing protein n=1 Tax=Dipteronia dyeriana TaxID=168575 RepID=A0AAD9U1X9_9ROSI|nr:hypothetical protein Ddye_021586 [Dipteronia dyeriana]